METRSKYFQQKSDFTTNTAATKRPKKKTLKMEYDNRTEIKQEVATPSKQIKIEPKDEDVEGGNLWYPDYWRLQLNNIQAMREDRSAVVDSQGCERTADKNETPEIQRFQTLVSLMLSSQTKDQVTFAAMGRLKEYGCTPQKLMNSTQEKIGQLIYPVGFWKRKSKYLQETATICNNEFSGDIPNSIKTLTSLPGVGPKMAYICMTAAWGQVDGIGVDTHVHRICNRLQWVQKPTKTPEQTRKALEAWLPRDEWKDINILLVGFGQQTCLPVHPRCVGCLNKDICPASTAHVEMKTQNPKPKIKKETK